MILIFIIESKRAQLMSHCWSDVRVGLFYCSPCTSITAVPDMRSYTARLWSHRYTVRHRGIRSVREKFFTMDLTNVLYNDRHQLIIIAKIIAITLRVTVGCVSQ